MLDSFSLSQISIVRECCFKVIDNTFLPGVVARAVLAVCGLMPKYHIDSLFERIKDFQGINFRYQQISTSDFIDYMILKFPIIFGSLNTNVATTLTCSVCRWVSFRQSRDSTLKLYFPFSSLRERSISLQDLISRNSQALLDGKNQVYCGKCGRNTSQRSSCSFENSIVLIEIVRVLTFRGEKSRNNSSVYFPLTGISLPGRSGTFSVVATCNHRGSFDTGHWFSQIQLSDGAWFKIDNLEGRHIPLPTIGKDNVGSN